MTLCPDGRFNLCLGVLLMFSLSNLPKLIRMVILLVVVPVIVSVAGCASPEWQGWSGVAYYEGTLFVGSTDGKLLAMNPSARSGDLSFPAADEWVFPIPTFGLARPVCGPACASPSPVVNIYATPRIADDLVYIATYSGESGRILAVNRVAPGYTEGAPMRSKGEWVYPSVLESIGAIVGSPVLYDGMLFFGSSDGKVYALDATYGEKKWVYDTGGKIWTSPAIADSVLYVSNYERRLCALSIQDGTLLWQKEFPASIASSPVVSNGKLFFGTFDHYFYALDATSGDVKWRFKGGGWFWATPVVKDGVVYAGCLNGKVYALKADTDVVAGEKLWEFSADAPIIAGPVLTAGGLAVASKSGKIYVLRVEDGDLVRTVAIGSQIVAPLCAVGDMIYIHARDRCIYGVNIELGEVVWKFSTLIK